MSISVFVHGPSTRTEILLRVGSLNQLKAKCFSITGVPIAQQILVIDDRLVTEHDDVSLHNLLADGSVIKVTSCDASLQHSLEEFANLTSVKKMEMSDEAYNKRQDTVRAFKERNKLGRFADVDKTSEESTDIPPEHIQVGERFEEVLLGRRGIVRFLGRIPELPGNGYWVGVEYDEPSSTARGNGSVGEGIKARKIFDCADRRGGFLRPDKVQCGPQYVDRLDEELDGL